MILVTGATGNAGGAVAAVLAERGIPHRGLVRRPDADLPDGTEPVVGDLGDPASLDEALDGADAIFLLAGYDHAERTLRRAGRAGVGRVVLLSSSSVVGTRTDNDMAAYHLAAERTVRESGLDWTFLRPNAFMSNALRWLPELQRGDRVRLQFPEVALSSIHPRDLADVAVAALTQDGHAGASYRLTGPEAHTPAQRLAILGEALGRPLVPVPLTLEETRRELADTMPAGYARAVEQFYADGIVDETSVSSTVEEVAGHPARTFGEWCRDHVADFA